MKYGERHGMSDEEFDLFQYLIEVLDTKYIEWVQKKADEGKTDG